MNILKKYLPDDLVNLIYNYIYSSMYYDVMSEMEKKTVMMRWQPFHGDIVIINGIRIELDYYTNYNTYNLAHGYCNI